MHTFLGKCMCSYWWSYIASLVEVWGFPRLSHKECVCVPAWAHLCWLHCQFFVHQLHALTHNSWHIHVTWHDVCTINLIHCIPLCSIQNLIEMTLLQLIACFLKEQTIITNIVSIFVILYAWICFSCSYVRYHVYYIKQEK